MEKSLTVIDLQCDYDSAIVCNLNTILI